MPSDPWTFGWTQLLTIVGFAVTAAIALGGFRTFSRWKKEKIEELKIEIALETLTLTYETKYIFDEIRSPMSFEYEWADMPEVAGETAQQRSIKGPYYAVKKRIVRNKDFFEKAFRLQPRCMAMFGRQAEDIFLLMHKARREIEVSSEMLTWKVQNSIGPQINQDQVLWDQCRHDIWDHSGFEPEKDKVGKKLADFTFRMEQMCRPIVDKQLKKTL